MRRAIARTALAALGLATQASSQLVAAMVLARFLLPEVFGRFTLAMGIVAPLALLFGMQLQVVVATNAGGRLDDRELAGLRLNSAGLLFTCGLVGLLLSHWSSHLLSLVFALVLWRSSDLVGEYAAGIRQRDNRYLASAVMQVLRAIGSYGLLVTSVIVTEDLTFSASVGALGAAVMVILMDVRVVLAYAGGWRHVAGLMRPRPPRKLVPIFAGLGVAAMLDSLVFNLPRYAVEAAGGSAEVARFSVAVYPVMLGGLLASSIAVAVRPGLARSFAIDRVRATAITSSLIAGSFVIGVILALAGFLYGDSGIAVMFGAAYSGLRAELTILLLGASFWFVAGFANSGVIASGRLSGQVRVYAWSAGSAVGCALLSILFGNSATMSGAIGVAGGMFVRALLSLRLFGSVRIQREGV